MTLGTGYEPAPEQAARSAELAAPKAKGGAVGRFAVINSFIDYTMGGLSQNDAFVWLALWRMTDAKTGIASAPYATVAERVGVSTKTVVRAVKRLRDAGLVVVVRQGGFRKGVSSLRVVPGDTPIVP